ncbi:MAG: DMT family transporter [Candidatus Eisenbacteria sp.]|nr:DMT family transporter [Candidatus Eisenbacteria bacterium]
MLTEHLGYLAGLATAVCWTVSAVFFTRAAGRIGGVTVNHARVVLSLPMMALIHLATQGSLSPVHVEPYRWGWLALSGVVGLALGDSCLFIAFALIGPRLSLLVMSLVPVISTTAAWIFLRETLAPVEIAGVLIAVIGIGWVVMERGGNDDPADSPTPRYGLGILLAFGGALGQALGLVVAKKGMAGDFPAISATLIRMLAAAATMWGVAALRGQAPAVARRICDRKTLAHLLSAVAIGSALGIWLSLVSIQYARLGIATTLMALPPVLILPLAYWQLRERITTRAVLGTIVTFAGIALLLMK